MYPSPLAYKKRIFLKCRLRIVLHKSFIFIYNFQIFEVGNVVYMTFKKGISVKRRVNYPGSEKGSFLSSNICDYSLCHLTLLWITSLFMQ